ncbi:MAG: DUF2892 domain-containing protein [Gemmatimonadaceae bacterium]|jgi:hypothetical protein|nr:DUF2892 domain-containing protein [Gemmatimonadaceae bacterium]
MCPDVIVRRIAGIFVLVTLALGTWVHAGWYGATAFVGLNLLQSSFTRWCLLERVLGRMRVAGCRPHEA